MALSLDDVKIPINKMRLKFAVLKWHLCLPGANEIIRDSCLAMSLKINVTSPRGLGVITYISSLLFITAFQRPYGFIHRCQIRI